jgi:hypothetical protein
MRTESTPPMAVKIARIDGSAKAAFRSSARARGSAHSSAGVRRTVGSSRTSSENTRRRASTPRPKTCG